MAFAMAGPVFARKVSKLSGSVSRDGPAPRTAGRAGAACWQSPSPPSPWPRRSPAPPARRPARVSHACTAVAGTTWRGSGSAVAAVAPRRASTASRRPSSVAAGGQVQERGEAGHIAGPILEEDPGVEEERGREEAVFPGLDQGTGGGRPFHPAPERAAVGFQVLDPACGRHRAGAGRVLAVRLVFMVDRKVNLALAEGRDDGRGVAQDEAAPVTGLHQAMGEELHPFWRAARLGQAPVACALNGCGGHGVTRPPELQGARPSSKRTRDAGSVHVLHDGRAGQTHRAGGGAVRLCHRVVVHDEADAADVGDGDRIGRGAVVEDEGADAPQHGLRARGAAGVVGSVGRDPDPAGGCSFLSGGRSRRGSGGRWRSA